MNLTELSSPIRMYWDLGPERDGAVLDHGRIAAEIAANKVLSLQITETNPALSRACFSILDTLKDKTIALSLVAPRTALDARTLGLLHNLRVKVVFMTAATRDELGPVAEIANHSAEKPAIGVSFSVSRSNFRDLPDVLTYCIDHGIANLLLPMQRLMEEEACFSFTAEERRELTARLQRIEKPAGLKITIHDPFLWRAFFPNVDFPNGGCQAANTMLYLSPEADVYPCPSLPVKIGSLLTLSLAEIIRSDRKKELRRDILTRPPDCEQCKELKQCKGGCRGRSYRMKKTLKEADPACR
jgi:GeoRSP system SPASM domain protein